MDPDVDKVQAGAHVLAEHVNHLVWKQTMDWTLQAPKTMTDHVFNEIWRDNEDPQNADKKNVLFHTSYEILDEIVSRARLAYVDIARTHRALIKENISWIHAALFFHMHPKVMASVMRMFLPVCREMMMMLRRAIEAYELHIKRNTSNSFSLTHSPLHKLSTDKSNRHIKVPGKELRKIAASIDELQAAVVLKYFRYEMIVRERTNWRKLNESLDKQLELVNSELVQCTKTASAMDITGKFNSFKDVLVELRKNYGDFKIHREKPTDGNQ